MIQRREKQRIRFNWLFSYWILILSICYPIVHIPTFPLNVLSLLGIVGIVMDPLKNNFETTFFILFIHLVPFLWIPVDFSDEAITIAFAFSIMYVLFTELIVQKSIVDIYIKCFRERHKSLKDFLNARFGGVFDYVRT